MVDKVSLSLPQVLAEIDLRMLMDNFALSTWMDVCLAYVSFGSKVMPRILGCRECGMG